MASIAKTHSAAHAERTASRRLKLWIEPAQSSDITAGPFRIDDRCKTVTVAGKRCKLSPKEYKLLKYLAREPGGVVSSDEIIRELWPPDSNAGTGDVKQYIHLLRRRIEPDPKHPRWIENVRGFGYRLAIDEMAA